MNKICCSLSEEEILWLTLLFGVIAQITSACQYEENELHLPQMIQEIKRPKCLIGIYGFTVIVTFQSWKIYLVSTLLIAVLYTGTYMFALFSWNEFTSDNKKKLFIYNTFSV